MKRDTNDIETAARHVVPGHRIVSRQRQIADHLIAQGHDASEAQYTLDLFIIHKNARNIGGAFARAWRSARVRAEFRRPARAKNALAGFLEAAPRASRADLLGGLED
jgi:hypothetical protein